MVSANVALDALNAQAILPKAVVLASAAPFGVGAITGTILSAAGGAIVPDDVMGGGGTLSILHPREMVLPAHISEMVQDMAASRDRSGLGDSGRGGGDTHHVHVGGIHIHAIDNASFEGHIDKHSNTIARAIVKEMRRGNKDLHSIGRR